MITRQQYLEAKAQKKEAERIIEQYEQIDYYISFENLEKNDYVTYVGGSQGKNLTIGKRYRLTCAPWNGRIAIVNDSGRREVYRLGNRYFEV